MSGCPSPDVLVAHGEGVLPEALEASVGQHLAQCRVCAVLRRDLRESPLAEPTLAEMDRIQRRLPGRRAPMRRVLMTGAAAAAIVMAIYSWPKSAPTVETASVKAPAATDAPKPAPAYRMEVKPAPLRLPLAAALVMRGVESTANEAYLAQLGKALDPYRSSRYAEAAELLEALGNQHPRAVEPPFYQGVARLLSGDAQRAAQLLETARGIGGEALDDDILWYLAAARERTGAWDQAEPLLRKLCGAEGPYREAACRIAERR